MSMLAEPRRKQKWSVDPRNSTWSNDDSKFGQKMLERMGWSKGKGLGRSEQGSTEHIKVKLKNNSYGLGANASYEDKWIAHQDDFNELLTQLNNCHGQNNSNDSLPDEPKGFSLEEKSKTTKKRVHYMKFTKGKDLSSRSETDLNCIFGKRGRSAKDQEQESSSSDSQGENEEKVSLAAPELDTESITKTVKSTLTMQEYFAQRMAQLKKARGQEPSATSGVEAETDETPGPSEEASPIHSSNSEVEEPKKKKKKKKKKATNELEVEEDNCSTPIVVEGETQEQECSKKKKKTKRKVEEQEGASEETCNSTSGVEHNCEELPPKKKKLKKHKTELAQLNGHEPSEDLAAESEVVQKKKKKHREEVGDVTEEEVVVKKSKNDKRKKKKRQE